MRRAPGLLRPVNRFAAGALFPEARAALESERARAMAEALGAPPHAIAGSDLSEPTLAIARSNAAKAGVDRFVRFELKDALEIDAGGGWIVSNPPYGERLADQDSAIALLHEFVHRIKHHGIDSKLALVLPRGDLEKAVGLKYSKRLAVESGSLGLRFLLFEIYSGSRKGARS